MTTHSECNFLPIQTIIQDNNGDVEMLLASSTVNSHLLDLPHYSLNYKNHNQLNIAPINTLNNLSPK